MLDAMARQGFEQVLALHDRESGLRAFLGIHDTARGPAFGGIRRWAYRDERQALLDCLRLSRSMSRKCALAGLSAGGAKLVVLDRPELDRAAAYRHVGRIVERLGGRFYTGPDLGTGAQELGAVAAETRYVTHPGPEGPGELAESTAEGVFQGIGVALRHLDGSVDWPRRRVCVQGLGAVGLRLAARLVGAGAHVLASDVELERIEAARRELPLEIVRASTELGVECDVFAPCALGGILHDLTVGRLRCGVVAGAANDVLARPLAGDRLHERGILYVPDVVLSSGALIRGAHFHLDGRREPVAEIGARVAGAVERILERAASERRPPARVALREADEILAESRRARS